MDQKKLKKSKSEKVITTIEKEQKKPKKEEKKVDETLDIGKDIQSEEKDAVHLEPDSIEPTEETSSESYFSSKKFSEMGLTDNTLKALDDLKYSTATEIQSLCIPEAMTGIDILGRAKTGSGKSLAFLIPAVELLSRADFKQEMGVGAIVLTPTRELALQLFNLAKDLLVYHKKTCALVMGGANRKVEQEKLRKGVNLIVATPGRLLDHLNSTKGFNYMNLSMMIIDEADAILKIGFEDELRQILDKFSKFEKQTLLFSATLTPKLEDLVTLSLRNYKFLKVSNTKNATVSHLEQGYVVVDADKKFLMLYTFIRKNLDKKIMVFFSSCNAVKFYSYLLNYIDVPVTEIHGNQKQNKRTLTYFTFCKSEKGILLCTDVAQRGLDIPEVDWIIQYDAPHDPEEYLHRVGRTARGATAKGKALLILLPTEVGLVRYLKKNNININEFEFPESKLAKISAQFEKLVEKNYYLYSASQDAYRSYLHAYISHKLKDVYDINALDLSKVCRSFGFTSPPYVNLNFKINSSRKNKKMDKGVKDKFHQKYGSGNAEDGRQFVK
jgi:ATP-dependent RNA helicase DDX18/HAS1